MGEELGLVDSIRLVAKGFLHYLQEWLILNEILAELPALVYQDAENRLVEIVELRTDADSSDEELPDPLSGRFVGPAVPPLAVDLGKLGQDIFSK